MSEGHRMEMLFEHGFVGPTMKAVCLEPPEAQCRWTSNCDCEVWYEQGVDEAGPFHVTEGTPAPLDRVELEDWLGAKCRMESGGPCRMEEWLNADDPMECVDRTRSVLSVPIEIAWDGAGYRWGIAP